MYCVLNRESFIGGFTVVYEDDKIKGDKTVVITIKSTVEPRLTDTPQKQTLALTL